MKYFPLNMTVLVWVLSAVGVAGLLFLVWKYLVPRVRRSAQPEEEAELMERPLLPSAASVLPHTPHEEPLPLTAGESARLAEQLGDTNLRELVQERLADIDAENEDTERWALALVNLLDELRLMQPSYSPQDVDIVSQLRNKLLHSLREHDCELIDLDEWTPTQQRATQVEHSLSAHESPRILSKGASGLIVRKRLIRKQEVSVNLPPAS